MLSIFFYRLYDRKQTINSFEWLISDYEYYKSRYSTPTKLISPIEKKHETESLISTTKKTPKKKAKSNDTSEVSLGHSKLNLSALYKWLEEKKWSYCIWMSKLNRDHNINPMGRLDPDGVTFTKLINGLGLTFSNTNTWENVIGKKDGLYFSFSCNKYGCLRFWINEYLSFDKFFELLQEKLKCCNLTTEEFKEIIECLEDDEKKKLFLLETANLTGPRDIIKEKFNKACLIYKKVSFNGLYLPIKVKIDKSKGPFETEFIGPYTPTRLLQDVTVNSVEVVESIGVLDSKLDSCLQIGFANNEHAEKTEKSIVNIESSLGSMQQLVMPREEVLVEFSEIDGRLFNLDIKTDIQHAETKTHFIDVLKASRNNANNISELIELLEQEIPELKVNFKEVIFENIEPVIAGQRVISEKIEDTKNKIDDLKNIVSEKFESLQEYLSKEFQDVKIKNKNAFYLIVRKLHQIPGLTVSEILDELNVSKTTVYSYFKKLQERELIDFIISKKLVPGRPSRVYNLTKKAKKILNKIKK